MIRWFKYRAYAILAVNIFFFYAVAFADVEVIGSGLAGSYRGIIPAADCPGIKVFLKLNKNCSYFMHFKYLERDSEYTENGNWKKVAASQGRNLLELKNKDNITYLLIRNNDRLEFLDAGKNRIPSGEHYTLTKE